MKRIHIIGRKNSGKTTLVENLVSRLIGRGFRVGTIKHTHHGHELDAPGKDSHRHRKAGASVVGILSRDMSAVFQPVEVLADHDDRYEKIAPLYTTCDMVIVEGNSMTTEIKLEVWRAEVQEEPMAAQDSTIHAVITDDTPPLVIECWPRQDVGQIADRVIDLLKISPSGTSQEK